MYLGHGHVGGAVAIEQRRGLGGRGGRRREVWREGEQRRDGRGGCFGRGGVQTELRRARDHMLVLYRADVQ